MIFVVADFPWKTFKKNLKHPNTIFLPIFNDWNDQIILFFELSLNKFQLVFLLALHVGKNCFLDHSK